MCEKCTEKDKNEMGEILEESLDNLGSIIMAKASAVAQEKLGIVDFEEFMSKVEPHALELIQHAQGHLTEAMINVTAEMAEHMSVLYTAGTVEDPHTISVRFERDTEE